MSYRSRSWWLFPVVGMLTVFVVLILAVRSIPGHEVECSGPIMFTAKSAEGELGYGVTWGPRDNRQSIVVFGTGDALDIRFESYGPPAAYLETRGPTKQFSDFPPEAVDLIRDRLAGEP